MRIIIAISTIMICVIYLIDARVNIGNKYVKNIYNTVDKNCNIDSYQKTKNIDLYNCFTLNSINNCRHMYQFDEYNNNRLICMNGYYSSQGDLIIISIFSCLILAICCIKLN